MTPPEPAEVKDQSSVANKDEQSSTVVNSDQVLVQFMVHKDNINRVIELISSDSEVISPGPIIDTA